METHDDDMQGDLPPDVAVLFVQAAKEYYHRDGELEIDADIDCAESCDKAVSAAGDVAAVKEEGGVYVQCWCWVSLDMLEEDDLKTVFGIV